MTGEAARQVVLSRVVEAIHLTGWLAVCLAIVRWAAPAVTTPGSATELLLFLNALGAAVGVHWLVRRPFLASFGLPVCPWQPSVAESAAFLCQGALAHLVIRGLVCVGMPVAVFHDFVSQGGHYELKLPIWILSSLVLGWILRRQDIQRVREAER